MEKAVQRLPRDSLRLLLFGLLAFIYLSAFPYHPKLRSPNELCRLWQARSLVEYGTLNINRALADYGYVGDLSVKDGRYYPSKAPLLSFAAVPVYAVLRWIGGNYRYAVPELPLVYFSRLLLNVLPTLAALIWLRRFLLAYVEEPVADGLTATYALGSLGFSYSLLFMSHQTTAVLLFASFYSLWRAIRGDWKQRGYLLSGAFAGAAVAAEYTSAIAVAGFALIYGTLVLLSGARRPTGEKLRATLQAFGLAAAGAAPFVLGLMAYHQACFGHPLHTGYRYLNDPAYQPWHTGGFLGVGLPDSRAFFQSFFSPLRGLFVLAPFLVLALPGLAVLFQRSRANSNNRALFWFSVALLLGYGYFTSSFSYESWGWTTGPRHLTGLVPFLVLPAALSVQWLRDRSTPGSRAALGIAAGLCVVSVLVTGTVTLVNYIPDSAANALFGVAIPLFRSGFLPPTIWAMLGAPNPWSGAVLIAAVVCTAIVVGALLLVPKKSSAQQRRVRALSTLAGFAICALYLAAVALATDSTRDAGAIGHLKSVWLVQTGQRVEFWPR